LWCRTQNNAEAGHGEGAGGERGVALILVLWVLALLTVLMLGFTGTSHTELLLARNNYQSAQAAAVADAGVSLALVGILDTANGEQWPADGRTRTLPFGDATMDIQVQDEAGKVDLNNAPPDLMAGVFQSLGLGDAGGIAAAIVDWRNRRQPAQQNATGAQASNDAAQEYGAFLSVDELRLVPGVSRAIYDRVRPYVTVYAPIGRIDPLTAPPEVLRGLPGVDPKQLAAFLAARDQLGPVPGALPPLSGVTRFLAHSGLHAATIRSTGTVTGGTRFVREAVVVVNGQNDQPYKFMTWRQGLDEKGP
jgi:general secretion pathway protein K